VSFDSILIGAQQGRARDVARLITAIENDAAAAVEVRRRLGRPQGMVIGVTGPPGVGKSTTTTALIGAYRARGLRVAVLAIDPSSPFSGGALLGDRVRMQEHSTDEGVFIRSMAARGHLGGLAAAAPAVMDALLGCGFDVVLVETVGVGQSEVDIAALADTVLVLVAPGMGDGIQAAKAGILEIADIFVVNKADRDGADTTARELRAMIGLGTWAGWVPPVVKTIASTGDGISDVTDTIDGHMAWLHESGEGERRRRARVRAEIVALMHARIDSVLAVQSDLLDRLAEEVVQGKTDVQQAARALSHRDVADEDLALD
jgi:LAO/AO transport system kinase